MNCNCKLCNATTREIYNNKMNTFYYYCENCEFISKDENSNITEEEELKIYNLHNNSIEDAHYVEYFHNFLNEAVVRYCGANKYGLDFGSGPSPVLASILKRDFGFAMDTYDKFYAPEKTYEGKKYSLVISTEVVEHFKNPLEYFKLFKELTAEGGIISIMTLFHPRNDAEFLEWFYIRDKSHVSFYTPKTMKYIGKYLGLKVVYSNGTRYTTFAISE